jgi:hypothetical protein
MYEHDVSFLRGYESVMLLVEIERKRSIGCNCDEEDTIVFLTQMAVMITMIMSIVIRVLLPENN